MNFFKRWFNADRVMVSKPAEADWIQRQGELIFTLRLSHLNDALDPDAIWDSGGDVVRLGDDSVTAVGRKSLKDALKTYRKETFCRKQGFDFPIPRHVVFTDVVVWIAESLWNEQDISGNEKLFMMVDKLRHRHGETFKGDLLQDRSPRYAVMPYAGLARHEIICQFGLGVFVPDEKDQQIAELAVIKGDQSLQLPVWWTLKAQGQLVHKVYRPAGFYQQQYFLLIGRQLQFSAIQSPLWFANNGGFLVINTRNQPETIHGDGLFVDADMAGVRKEHGATYCRFFAKQQPGDALELRITPLVEAAPANSAPPGEPMRAASFSQSSTAPSAPSPSPETHTLDPDTLAEENPPTEAVAEPIPGMASYPDATFVGSAVDLDHPLAGFTVATIDEEDAVEVAYGLYLSGLLLPKTKQLPGQHRYWQLILDRDGMPVNGGKMGFWCLRGHTDGRLEWKKQGDDAPWRVLTLNGNDDVSPEFSDIAMLLQKTTIEGAFAVYQLPFPLALAGLEPRQYSVGRHGDIPLNLLDQPGTLGGGVDDSLTLNQLRLSGQHVYLELLGEQLQLRQHSSNAPTYVRSAAHGMQCLSAGSGETCLLQAGDSFILGCYQLLFKSSRHLD